MASNSDRSIRYYHYKASPYAAKIVWYLTLRQLPWAEVVQPNVMPRPDLKAIGVAYRRIPLMAIGKDVYCDTRIILRKLEELFPEGKLGATTPEDEALQKLIEVWSVEAGLFTKAAQSMPLKFFGDPKFSKDREQMTGRAWSKDTMAKTRPESLVYVRGAYSFYEKLLADGRHWVLKTEQPSLTDIDALFIIHWLKGLPGALPKDLFSRSQFPNVYAWMERFDSALKTAKEKAPKPASLDGATAAKQIFAADFAEPEGSIDPVDPQELRKGDHVELFPTDSGMLNKDRGVLLGLNAEEITIGLDNGLRLHTPRTLFRVRRIGSNL